MDTAHWATRISLRYADLDLFGHVYHAVHLSLFEEARDAWLATAPLGWGRDAYVIVRTVVDYKRELCLTDSPVQVDGEVASVGRSSVQFRERLRTRAGALVAEATVTVVRWDAATGSTKKLTDAEHQALASSGRRRAVQLNPVDA